MYSERDVNSTWSKWKELFLSVCNKHAPIRHKVLRGILCPWLTSATKKLMNERDSFLRKARKTGSEVDWSTYRRLRNQVSNRIKIEKRRYQRNEIQDNLANPKSFWRAMKSIFPNKERKSSTVQSIITDEGETITSKSTILSRNLTSFSRTLCPSPWNPFNQLPFLVSQMKSLLMKVLCFSQFPKTLFLSN